ncbi:hypothetical protein XENOCAPTIV_028031, partial [Xenoophorus captivus]
SFSKHSVNILRVSQMCHSDLNNQGEAENCDQLTWRRKYIKVNDENGLPAVCLRLEDLTFICSSVISRHVLQNQGHVSILHLCLLQIHPVLIR